METRKKLGTTTKGNYSTRASNRRSARTLSASKENTTSSPPARKRKVSKHNEEKEVSNKVSRPSKADQYCFKCHTLCDEERCAAYPRCLRIYHSACLTRLNHFDSEGRCPSCQFLAKGKYPRIGQTKLSKLLLSIIKTACPLDDENYAPIINWPISDNEKLVCVKDIRYIHDKCTQDGILYKSPAELIEDLKWIHHNSVIIYGDKTDAAENSKKLLDTVIEELNDAFDCLECYYTKKSGESLFFVRICKMPHSIIWAKVRGHPYWPAKCLRVEHNKAHVRFFQTHQRALVPIANCYFMSKEYPKASKMHEILFKPELTTYIDCFEDKFGDFPYQPVNTLFDYQVGENIMKEILQKYSDKCRRTTAQENLPPYAVLEIEEDEEPVDLTGSNPLPVCIGSLLPGMSVPLDRGRNENWMSDETPDNEISISNIISGIDLNDEEGNLYVMRTADEEPASNAERTPSVYQDCLKRYDRAADSQICTQNVPGEDDDIEFIEEVQSNSRRSNFDRHLVVQTILRHDPKAYPILRDANHLVQQLFVQFWSTGGSLSNPEFVVDAQANEIKNLQDELDELRKQVTLMKNNYGERLGNADKIVKALRVELMNYKEKNKVLSQKLLKLEDLKNKGDREKEAWIEREKELAKERKELENTANEAVKQAEERAREAWVEKENELEKVKKELEKTANEAVKQAEERAKEPWVERVKELEKEKKELEKTANEAVKQAEERAKEPWVERVKELEKEKKNLEESANKAVEQAEEKADKIIEEAKNWCSLLNCKNNATRFCCVEAGRVVKRCSSCYEADVDHKQKCRKPLCMNENQNLSSNEGPQQPVTKTRHQILTHSAIKQMSLRSRSQRTLRSQSVSKNVALPSTSQ